MKPLLFSFFLLALLNCKKNESLAESPVNAALVDVVQEGKTMEVAKSAVAAPPPPMEEPAVPQKLDTISKKLIKNGEMSIQVGNIKSSQTKVYELLKKYNAYTQNENFRNSDTSENLDLVIRVPHKNFDMLVNSFSDGIGEVTNKSISVDDVTEEYTDISIKLANKKIYLEKYRDLLKRSSNTKDLLEIQEKIRRLEDEIDVAEGRLRYINDKVNYSTLNLSLYKEKPRTSITSNIGFGSRFADSLAEGWNSFISFLLGLVSLWPFLLLIPVFVVLWRKWRARKKSKKDK